MSLNNRISMLMSDGKPRTSYDITAQLCGPNYAPPDWFRIAAACDRMSAAIGAGLDDCGKREHRTVYVCRSVDQG